MNSKKQSRLYGVPVCTPRRAPGQRSIAIALDLYRIVSVDAPDGADVEQYRAAVIGRIQGKLYLSDADYATHMTPDDYEVIGVADHKWVLSPLTRNGKHILCIARWVLNHWTTREVHNV